MDDSFAVSSMKKSSLASNSITASFSLIPFDSKPEAGDDVRVARNTTKRVKGVRKVGMILFDGRGFDQPRTEFLKTS